jgi:hypothetical protein
MTAFHPLGAMPRLSYVSPHRDAQFSHRICPDCREGVVKDQLESRRGGP